MLAAVTVLLLLVPTVGSVYPVPAPPGNIYPYLFLVYFLIGAAWLWGRSARSTLVETELTPDLVSAAQAREAL